MKKKILFLTSSYPYGIGEGFIEPELISLSNKFQLFVTPIYPRGEEKNIFILNGNIKYNNLPLLRYDFLLHAFIYLLKKPLLFFSLIQLSCQKDIKKMFSNLILIPKAIFIAKYVKFHKIDFIYAHWLSAPTQLALLLNKIVEVPYGVTGHRWDIVDRNNFHKKFEKASFVRLISNYSVKILPKDIYLRFKSKILILKMGVSLDKDIKLYPGKYKSSSPFKGVCVANLIEVKGHIYLLKALSKLKIAGVVIYMDFIGDGNLKNKLVELSDSLNILEQVNFLGQMEHIDVINKLKNEKYNFCCLPSLNLGGGMHEGIPVSLMEAMGNGIPCISTKTGSIEELINDMNTGLLVQDKNYIELSQAILKLYLDSNLRYNLAHNALNEIKSNYNEDINNKQLINFIFRFIS